LKHKIVLITALISVVFYSCKSNSPIVEANFTDSLINNYQPSKQEIVANGDFEFWKSRMDSMLNSNSTALQFAGSLVNQFHMYGI
jgi:hypothetical protein